MTRSKPRRKWASEGAAIVSPVWRSSSRANLVPESSSSSASRASVKALSTEWAMVVVEVKVARIGAWLAGLVATMAITLTAARRAAGSQEPKRTKRETLRR